MFVVTAALIVLIIAWIIGSGTLAAIAATTGLLALSVFGFGQMLNGTAPAPKTTATSNSRSSSDNSSVKVLSFQGLRLYPDRVSYKGNGGPVRGAVARIESPTEIEKRISLTRVTGLALTTALFSFGLAAPVGIVGGLLWKKNIGNVFLTVDHDQYQVVVPVPQQHEKAARLFAAKITNAGK
jgi:hypothetical protein